MKVTIELQAGRGCFHFAPRSPLVAVADSISLRRELLQGRVLYERFQRFQCKDFSFGAAQQLLHVLATDAEAPSANARNHLKTRFASSRCAQRPQMLNPRDFVARSSVIFRQLTSITTCGETRQMIKSGLVNPLTFSALWFFAKLNAEFG